MKLTAKILVPILAVSLSQIARAVAFSTDASGDWSDPFSWDPAGASGFPDTYALDSVTINTGHVINYDDVGAGNGPMSTPVGLVPVVTGGFAIALGNSVTIDGGTLTQTTLTQEMRIGEGTSGAGTGTMTIQTGGILNTGASIGLGVGTTIDGVGLGDGLLDILDGQLIMGAGAAVGGLGVGIDLGTGIMNVGDGIGGAGSSSVDLATNNVLMGIGASNGFGGGTGVVTVASDGAITFGTGAINVGQGGGTGTLSILAGGTMTGGSGAFLIGQGAGSTGTLLNSGAILGTGEVRIGGGGGAGTFTMSNGSLATTGEFNIGRDAGSTGAGTLSGGAVSASNFVVGRDGGLGTLGVTGGSIAASGQFVVGQDSGAANVVTISAGTVTSGGETRVGQGVGATGTLNISGTTAWTSGGELQVGNGGGSGTMNISGGTMTINQWGAIGRDGGTGVVNLSGTGTIQMGGGNQTFDIGVFGGAGNPVGTGTLTQTGGTFINTVNQTSIGRDASGVGFWNMSGGAATLTGRNLVVGNSGQGTAVFTGGTVSGVNQLNVGANGGSTGTLSVNYPLATDTLPFNELFVGNGAGTVGLVNVVQGKMDLGGWSEIGRNGGTGTVNITGPTASFDGSGSDMQIGYGGGATGAVNITAGGTMTHNWWINLGRSGGGNGTILVDGAGSTLTQTAGRLNIGGDPNNADVGTGLVTVSNGAAYAKGGDELNLGTNATSVGTLNILSGGTFTKNDGDTRVGRNGGSGSINVSGTGSLLKTANTGGDGRIHVGVGAGSIGVVNVNAGGAINTNTGWFGIGVDGGAGTATFDGAATVNGTGATLTANGIIVGWSGLTTGTLNIHNGAVVSSPNREVSVGRDNGGANSPTGIVNVTTGGLLTGRDLRFGHNTIGIVNVSSGGTVTNSAGWAIIGDGGASNGTVNMTNGNFNVPTDSLLIANNPGAIGVFTQGGASTTTIAGELILSRDRAFATLNVNGGTFSVNGGTNTGRDNNGNVGGLATINVTNGGIFSHTPSSGDMLLGWKDGSTGNVNINTGGQMVYNWWVRVAVDAGSTGAITVDGAGSQMTSDTGRMFIGESGIGTLTITNGGSVVRTNSDWFVAGGNDGANSKGNGTVNISGAGSSLTSNNFLAFGRGRQDALNLATGTLNMTSGSISSSGSWIGFGTDQGQGTANISGTATGTSAGETIIGRTPNSIGTFNLSDSAVWTSGGEFQVGNNGGVGVANISGGTLNLLSYLAIGRNTGDNAGLNGGNGTLNLSGTGIIQKVSGGGSFDVGSWNGGLATTVNTSGTLNQTGGSVVVGNNTSVYVGRDTGVSGNWNITGGDVSATVGEFRIHNSGGAATDVMTVGGNGAFTLTAANNSAVGQGGGTGTGTLNITNPNATFTFNNEFWVGNDSGTGVMNMSAGSITANSWFDLGRNSATGTVNLSGTGSITKLTGTGQLNIGSSGTGQGFLNQSGGAITNTAVDTLIARDPSTVGIWSLTNGTATLARFNIGNSGIGTLSISGGSISASDRVSIGTNAGATGTATLTGGVITTQFVEAGAGTATLTMNGGTLRAFGNEGDFLRNINVGNSEILAGGAIFDSNTFSMTANNQFDGVGGVKKLGTGTLTLTAANLYFGGTIIDLGTLNVNADAALGDVTGGVTINNNAILQAAANVTTDRTVTLGLGGGQIDANGQIVTLDTLSTLTGTALTTDSTIGGGVVNIQGTQTYDDLTTQGLGVTNMYTALGTGTSTITANATLNVYVSQTLASLDIGAGTEVTFGDGLPFAPFVPKSGAGGAALVPEPGSLGLLLVGVLGFAARRRRTC